jgi:CHAD domain-containing protein
MTSAKRQVAADSFIPLLQRFNTQLKKTLRNPGEEPIHDLRVAIRRLEQVLITFHEWFDERKLQATRRRLKTLFANAGAVRDCDVAIELLGKSGTGDVTNISDHLHLQRKRAQHRLVASMRGMLRQDVTSRWRSELFVLNPPLEDGELSWDELAGQELPRRARDFFRSGARARKKSSPADLHKFRIAAKKFRYTFELFESAYGPTAESRLENLRDVQSVLGDINDIRIARKLILDLGGGKKLDSRLRKKLHKRISEFHTLWEAHFPPSEVKEWMEFLERPPRKPVVRAEVTQLRAIAAR